MATIQLKTNRLTGAQSPLWGMSKRFLYLMAAFIAAAMTLASCVESDENEGNENGENGGGSSVSGKRIKSWVQETSRPSDYVRVEYTYNSDGSFKQADQYDATGHYTKSVYTNNSDGTPNKIDQSFVRDATLKNVSEFTYTNKTLKSVNLVLYTNGVVTTTGKIDYTFVNGKKTLEVQTNQGGAVTIERAFEYDSNGKRTGMTETQKVNGNIIGTRKYTRSYKDGLLHTVTFPWGPYDPTPVTMTVTWENGKKTVDEDIFLAL